MKRMKMYWQGRKDVESIFVDPVDGLNGVRKDLLNIIPDGESILDIGCGLGHITEIFRLAGRKNTYLGVDVNLEVITWAKNRFGDKFDLQDANFLPYIDNSFDNCILFTVVEMLPDFRKAVEEAVRVSKKRVVIALWKTLQDAPDKNDHGVNNVGEYCVNINRERFLKHLNSFGYPVIASTLNSNFKTEYWMWVIKKE